MILLASQSLPKKPPDNVESLTKVCELLDRLLNILKEFPPLAKLIEAAYWRGFFEGAVTTAAIATGLIIVWHVFLKKS